MEPSANVTHVGPTSGKIQSNFKLLWGGVGQWLWGLTLLILILTPWVESFTRTSKNGQKIVVRPTASGIFAISEKAFMYAPVCKF
jgi:hypothetical protein